MNSVGAIIRVLYYILKVNNKTKDTFSSKYVCSRYKEIINNSQKQNTIKKFFKFKKHSGKNNIKTLENEVALQQWLNKHTKIKPIFWFVKLKNNEFRIKRKHIKFLNDLIKK